MGSVAGVLHIVPSDFVHRASNPTDTDFLIDDSQRRNWCRLQLVAQSGNSNIPIEFYVDWEMTSMHVRIINKSAQPLSDLAIAINKNPIGMTFASIPKFPPQIPQNEASEIEIPVTYSNDKMGNFENGAIDIALKTNFGTVFAKTLIPATSVTLEAGRIESEEFKNG